MNDEPTIFSPLSGITLWVGKIPWLMDLLFHSRPDPAYKTLPGQELGQKDFTLPFLSREEFKQVNGFKVQKKQVEWICGRFALKTLVQKILCPGLPLAEIQISYHEKGAPFLARYPELGISLSHSNEYTAVGLCQNPGARMGIDIEKIRNTPDSYFMKTAFTPREIHHMALEASEIYRHWTLKEAFLKYIGMGFNESLHAVEIIENTLFYRQKKQSLNLWSRTIEAQYVLSIVADPPPATARA